MKTMRFFTLIEVLAAITIIVILSLIGFGSYSYATNTAKTARSQALLKNLEAGLEGFCSKTNYYPGSGGVFSPVIVTLGTDKTVNRISFGGTILEDSASDPIKKTLFDNFAKAADLDQFKQNRDKFGRLTDAWGGVIYYCAPGVFGSGNYNIISAGPNGKFSSDNADTPVGITDVSKYRNASGEPVCDDLFNF